MSKIMITFEEGKNGSGPYQSHQRIVNSSLNEKYDFVPLIVKRYKRDFFKIKMLRNLVKQIKKENPDLIHVHGLQIIGFVCCLAAKICKKKIVLVIRGSSLEAINFSNFKKRLMKRIEKKTMQYASTIYCVSDYVLSWPNLDKFRNKIYGTIYNLGPNENIETLINREDLMINDNDIVIATSGRITIEKGYDQFLKLISFFRLNKKVKFIVIGDGNYLNEMKAFITREKIETVIFTGYVSNVLDYLKITDIFVMCSKHETLCNSIIEAMSCSLPIIASNVGGIPELVDNNFNGYLYELNDEIKFFNYVKELVDNESLRVIFGNNSKNKYESKFSSKAILKNIDKIYQDLSEEKDNA